MTRTPGRPLKQGLDYFALDVTMNDEISIIEASHGITAFAVLIKLYQKIYSEGYYIEWTEREQLLASNRFNVDINLLIDVINDCIKWGIFDQELYDKHKILTSRRIQEHFIRATYRRMSVVIVLDYWIEEIPERDNLTIIDLDGNDLSLENEQITVYADNNLIIDDNNLAKKTLLPDSNSQSKSKSKSKSKRDTLNESNILLLNHDDLSDLNPPDNPDKEPPIPPKIVQEERFNEFWTLYPKKRGKQNAIKAWKKIKPDKELFEEIIKSVEKWKKSHDWKKEGGQYIPYPATWLNAGGWEDELPKGRQVPYYSERFANNRYLLPEEEQEALDKTFKFDTRMPRLKPEQGDDDV